MIDTGACKSMIDIKIIHGRDKRRIRREPVQILTVNKEFIQSVGELDCEFRLGRTRF